jgi:hypothetical protein
VRSPRITSVLNAKFLTSAARADRNVAFKSTLES